jgi:hypothetical protein
MPPTPDPTMTLCSRSLKKASPEQDTSPHDQLGGVRRTVRLTLRDQPRNLATLAQHLLDLARIPLQLAPRRLFQHLRLLVLHMLW